MKKLISFALAILMILPIAVSCSPNSGEPNPGTTTSGEAAPTTPGDTTTVPPSDTDTTTTAAPTTGEPEPERVPSVEDDINLPKIDSTTLEIIKNEKTSFRIVYAGASYASAAEQYKNAANLLKGKLRLKFNVALNIFQSTSIARVDDSYEILVGATGRPESDMALQFANGANGFVIKAIGKKLVINAFTDKGLTDGVNYFIDEFITKNTDEKNLTFTSANDYASEPEYPHPEYKMAGYSYKAYTIVVPENAGYSELRTARRVQYIMGTVVGVLPKVVYDNETGHAENFEILIGETNRTSETTKAVEAMEYVVNIRDAKVEINAGSIFAWEQACTFVESTNKFLKDLNNEKKYNYGELTRANVTKSMESRGNYAADKKEGEYRMVFHNVWGWNEDTVPGVWGYTKLNLNATAQRNLMMAELYRDLDADVVALQEYTDRLMRSKGNSDIGPIMEEYGYSQVCTSAGIGSAKSATPIFYKTDKFELLESDVVDLMQKYPGCGGDKYMTVAVLKDKTTNDIFAVISLHADYRYSNETSEQAIYDNNRRGMIRDACNQGAILQNKYNNCPVFIGGDMNCITKHTPFSEFANKNYVDAQDEAKNSDGGNTAFAKPTWDTDQLIFRRDLSESNLGAYDNDAIDHIMFNAPSDNIEIARYDILTDISSASISDHMPHLIDFNIN